MPITDIKGYCIVKNNAKGVSPESISSFQGKICVAFEINKRSKSALLINPEGTALGMFDLDQIDRYFECQSFNGLLVPPNLNTFAAMQYVGKVFSCDQNRTRDMDMIRKVIISTSLVKGKFTDDAYFMV